VLITLVTTLNLGAHVTRQWARARLG
jgi:hypothetical protein